MMRLTTRGMVAACSAVPILSFAWAANAGPSKLSLTWNAPEQLCPSPAQVARDALELVGPGESRIRKAEATATVTQAEDGSWKVELVTEIDGHKGTRTLDARTCEELADATSLIVALMIDPQTKRRSRPPPIRDALTGSPSQQQAPVGPSKVGVGIELSGIADSGTLPAAAMGLQAAGRWHLGPATLEAHGAWWPGTTATMSDRPSIGGDFRLVAAGVLACLSARSAGVSACFGPEVDHMTGKGNGVSSPGTGAATWVGPLVALRGEVPLTSWLSILLQAGAMVPLQRPEFVIEGAGVVHRPAPVAARASLGLVLEL